MIFVVQGIDPLTLSRNMDFDVSSLAQITEGYSAGTVCLPLLLSLSALSFSVCLDVQIKAAVEQTLPPRRVQRIKDGTQALITAEMFTALSKLPYTFKQEFEAFKTFHYDITGEKERGKMLAERESQDKVDQDSKKKKGNVPVR